MSDVYPRQFPGGSANGCVLVKQLVREDEVSSHSPLLECCPAQLLKALLIGKALHAVDVLGDRTLDTFEHLYVGLQMRPPGLDGVLEVRPNV